MLELHCHTTCSDGSLTPTELVAAGAKAGVKAIAITDHDTLAGWEEAETATETYDIELVPGVELSTVHRDRSLHILGFYPDRDRLASPLQDRVAGRQRRAAQMAEKLAELGYPITLPTLSQGMAPGRPHIAAALVQAGHVANDREAFDRWLGEGKPAYVQYEKFSIIEGITLLRECGGVPVWAHPVLFRGGTVRSVFPELLAAGLMGIEVYHPSHSPSDIRQLEDLCADHDLVMTGGSDYHGPGADDPTFKLNHFKLGLDLLDDLKAAAGGMVRQ